MINHKNQIKIKYQVVDEEDTIEIGYLLYDYNTKLYELLKREEPYEEG